MNVAQDAVDEKVHCVIDMKSSKTTDNASATTSSDPEDTALAARLHDYLRLDVDLAACYARWSRCDPKIFGRQASAFAGIRILRIDPVENLFSFICSSNNNIGRITKMVDALGEHYGRFLGEVGGQRFYTFPEVRDLVDSGRSETLQVHARLCGCLRL